MPLFLFLSSLSRPTLAVLAVWCCELVLFVAHAWLLLQVSDSGEGLSISTIERPDKDSAVEEADRFRASGGPEPSTKTCKLPDDAETAVGNS